MKRPTDWLTYVIWGCVAAMVGIVLTWFVMGKPVGSLAFVICGGIAVVLHPIRRMRAHRRAAMSPEEYMRDNAERGLRVKN